MIIRSTRLGNHLSCVRERLSGSSSSPSFLLFPSSCQSRCIFSQCPDLRIIDDIPGLTRKSSPFKDRCPHRLCYVPVNHCCTEMTVYGVQRSQLVASICQLSSRCKAMAATPNRCKRPFNCLSNAIPRPSCIAMLDYGCSRISCKFLPSFFLKSTALPRLTVSLRYPTVYQTTNVMLRAWLSSTHRLNCYSTLRSTRQAATTSDG